MIAERKVVMGLVNMSRIMILEVVVAVVGKYLRGIFGGKGH